MAVPLRKMCQFGYAIQAAEGTAKAVGDMIMLPLPAGESLVDDMHKEVIDYADGLAMDRDYFEKGRWVEGDVQLPMLPSYMSDILDWTLTRDGEAQAQFGTVWVSLPSLTYARKYYDGKVATARLQHTAGNLPQFTVTLRCKKVDDASTDTFGAATVPTARAYKAKSATFSLDPDGAVPVYTCSVKEFTLEIDNRVMSGEDGMRICPYVWPFRLDNGGHPKVTGTISEDFRSSDLYDAWLAEGEGSLTYVLEQTQGLTTYTCTLTLPRIFYPSRGHPNIPDGDEYANNEVPFIALGALDGSAGPITWVETSA